MLLESISKYNMYLFNLRSANHIIKRFLIKRFFILLYLSLLCIEMCNDCIQRFSPVFSGAINSIAESDSTRQTPAELSGHSKDLWQGMYIQ